MKVLYKVLPAFIFAMSLMACSQKEDRKTRANVGRPVDANTANLQNQLNEQGMGMVVHSIDKTQTSSYYEVATRVTLGNETRTIYFQHPYERTEVYQNQIGGFQYRATSFCYFSTQCQDYVIMIEVYMNNTMLYQVGLYRDFSNASSDTNTIYKVVSGSSPVSFDSMINYLASPY